MLNNYILNELILKKANRIKNTQEKCIRKYKKQKQEAEDSIYLSYLA